ncbi:hypothetical protein ABZ656_58155, partial [Streptomyces sp. NPDC007095]
MSVIHQVPMCRQLIPAEEWEQQGGWALGDRLEWSNRACGMAALRMILLAYTGTSPSVTELLKLGEKRGARVERGWVHAALANLAGGHCHVVGCVEIWRRVRVWCCWVPGPWSDRG